MGPSEIVAIVVAFVGAVTGAIAWVKTRAEAESIAVATSIELIETLRTEVGLLRIELDTQREHRQNLADELHSLRRTYTTELTSLRKRVATLEDWIKSQGTDPRTIT